PRPADDWRKRSRPRPRARSFPGENAAGDGDVFAAGILSSRHRFGQRTFVPHLGELHQHRKIDAGENLDLRPAHHRDREVGGRAAEHIGEDGDPFPAVPPFDRFDVALAGFLDVVVGPDRPRLDLLLRADYVFQGRPELSREASMGDEYEADHGAPRRRVPVAPHERPPIMTIRSPCARGFPAICGWCCIAAKGVFRAPRGGGTYRAPVTFVPPGLAARIMTEV